MSKKRNKDGSLITPLAGPEVRVENLIVVRESDVSDLLLMQGMVDKTLYGCNGTPGVEAAKKIGLDPFKHPLAYGAQVKNTPTHKMVLFAIEGTLFFYAMGSAAKEESEQSGNDFIEFLMEIMKQYQPQVMTLANITRLMRSTRRVGELQSLLSEIGCVLRLDGGSLINVREPSGTIQFIMLSTFAAFERDHIVMRMLAGLVASAARGGLSFREEHLPLGYILENGVVRPDLERVEDVKNFLTILGLDLTRRQMAEAMSSAGIRLNRSFGPNKTQDPRDARDLKGFIANIESWLDLYETGIHKVKRENPFIGLNRIGVAPVIRTSETDPGYVEVVYNWGIPKGGWVCTEILAKARSRFANTSSVGSGGVGHKIRKPLLGLVKWSDSDGFEWVLDSHQLSEYRLRKRKYSKDALRGWAEASIDGEIVARFESSVLHKSIADEITKTITTGVVLEKLQGHYIGQFAKSSFVDLEETMAVVGLESEAKRLRKQADRARTIVLNFSDEQDAWPWIKDAIECERKANEIDMQIAEAQNNVKLVQSIEEQVPTDVQACARALAVLRLVDNNAPKAVSEALGQILRDITFTPTKNGMIQWNLFLVLPTQEGAIRVGPITGEIEPVLKKLLSVRSPLTTAPRVAAVLSVFSSGGTMTQALEAAPDWSAEALKFHVAKALAAKGLPSKTLATLINAKVPELRMAVISGVLHQPNMTVEDIPRVAKELNIANCSLEWVEHVLRFYLFSQRSGYSINWAANIDNRQEILDHILKAEGEVTVGDLEKLHAGGLSRADLVSRLLRPKVSSGSTDYLSLLEAGNNFQISNENRVTTNSTLRLVTCPHCGGFASRVIIVPEVTRQLLCPSCRKMPIENSPQFPISYLTVAYPWRSLTKGDWSTKADSITAQQYLASLSAQSLAKMQILCKKCGESFIKRGPTAVMCDKCGGRK